MDWIYIFFILGSLFYGARIFLDFNQTVVEINEKIDVSERQADRLAELMEGESRQKLEAKDRVATLKQPISELEERATSLKADLETEREQENRIQLALTKNIVRNARSRRAHVIA